MVDKNDVPGPCQEAADLLRDAVEVLAREGIIMSPEYWQANAVTGRFIKGEFVASLVLRMAERLKGVMVCKETSGPG